MRNENIVYKLEFKIPRTNGDIMLSCPEQMFAYRVRDNKTNLIVTVIYTDNDSWNTVKLSSLMYDLQFVQTHIEHDLPMPSWLAPHPLDNTIAYRQTDCGSLIEFYSPLIHYLAKKMYTTLSRFYTYDDLLQQCYLTVIRLARNNYYCSKKLIERAYVNDVFTDLRKLPTKYVILSFDEPTNDTNGDDAITRLIDTIADTDDKFDDVLTDDELIYRRKKVIKIIGQRRYDQMLREYRTKTTSNATTTTVNKLKRRFENE